MQGAIFSRPTWMWEVQKMQEQFAAIIHARLKRIELR